MAERDAPITVEVVYAQGQTAAVEVVTLAQGSRVADALHQAAQRPAFAGIDLTPATVGIYGVVVAREQILHDGDRIEIYRPLTQDPKMARRNRARAASRRP
jgi:putative ubiquitin-RnfH superfamily antitoxin RatB of RatAB toxin-antitoxin module